MALRMNDIENDLQSLQRWLKKLKMGNSLCAQELALLETGDCATILALTRKLLFHTSPAVARLLLLKNCSSSCSDRKLVVCSFDLLREQPAVRYFPVITSEQFLGKGFAHHKLIVLAKIAELVCLRSSRSSTGSAGAVSGQKQSLGQNHGQNSNPDSDAGSSCRDSDRASNGYSNHSDNNSEAGNSGASSDRNGARGVNRVADSAARPDQGLSIAYQHYEDRLGISEVNSPVEDSEGPQYDRNSDLLVSDSPGADYQQNSKPPTYSRKSSAQSLLSPDVSPIHQKKSFHVIDDMEEMGTEMHRNELMETVNNNYDSYSYTGNSKPHSYSNIDNSSRKYTLYSHQSDADEAEENVTDKAINTFNKYSRSGDYANNKYTSNGSAKAVRYENSDYQLVTEDTLLDRIKRSYFQDPPKDSEWLNNSATSTKSHQSNAERDDRNTHSNEEKSSWQRQLSVEQLTEVQRLVDARVEAAVSLLAQKYDGIINKIVTAVDAEFTLLNNKIKMLENSY